MTTVDGSSLVIPSASRVHIGRYYCIASNGIPPTVSKTISLKVQCKYSLSIMYRLVIYLVVHIPFSGNLPLCFLRSNKW